MNTAVKRREINPMGVVRKYDADGNYLHDLTKSNHIAQASSLSRNLVGLV